MDRAHVDWTVHHRIATRYENRAISYLGRLTLAAIMLWL